MTSSEHFSSWPELSTCSYLAEEKGVNTRNRPKQVNNQLRGHVTGYQPIRNQYFLIWSFITTENSLESLGVKCNIDLKSSGYRPPFDKFPIKQEPTETSKQPIITRYLGHVTGYQPIRNQYFLIWSYYTFLTTIPTSRNRPKQVNNRS
eukprot:sb/3473693/